MRLLLDRRVLVCCIFISVVAAVSIARNQEKSASTKTSWKISADLEEACSCNGPCPCWFAALPSRMTCDGCQVVFIKKGQHGKLSLDGLAMAQFVKSPEGQTMLESFGNWDFDIVYIDEKANAEQRKALEEIATHVFPLAAKKREVHYAPILRAIDGNEHRVTVGKLASFSAHLIDGGYAGPPKVVNPPLADPSHKEFLQGRTTKLTYVDAGQNWNFENSNYMQNAFDVDSAEYEKYEADLAAKMAAMKKAKPDK